MFSRFINTLRHRISFRYKYKNRIPKEVQLPKRCFISNTSLSISTRLGEGINIFGVLVDGKIEIGDFTSIWGPNVELFAGYGKIKIGKFCSIARNVTIYNFNHILNRPSTFFFNKRFFTGNQDDDIISKGDVEIGNDVWIGANSVILSGVKVGNGAVIAAGSIVSKDVPPYAVVGGNPAIVLKFRFSDEVIDKLLELKWWDWAYEKILANQSFFNKDVVECKFLDDIK